MSIPRDIIVIGAAEGSLPFLQRLLTDLPASLPAAVLVVLHAPLDALQLDLMLGDTGALPLVYARECQAIRHGQVYLAAPDTELVIRPSGVLGIDPIPLGRERRSAIDRLFLSAADVLGFRVIAVLLSRYDGAGTQGLHAVERADGIGIVQEPAEAPVPEMPEHAIKNDKPHYVAPIDGIVMLLNLLTRDDKRSSTASSSINA
ncbi:MAG: chemotaxis protein CheB [Pseudomonas sp.]|nr:MAG: chemotaxis protein CheB [Pseudomonas sp.]